MHKQAAQNRMVRYLESVDAHRKCAEMVARGFGGREPHGLWSLAMNSAPVDNWAGMLALRSIRGADFRTCHVLLTEDRWYRVTAMQQAAERSTFRQIAPNVQREEIFDKDTQLTLQREVLRGVLAFLQDTTKSPELAELAERLEVAARTPKVRPTVAQIVSEHALETPIEKISEKVRALFPASKVALRELLEPETRRWIVVLEIRYGLLAEVSLSSVRKEHELVREYFRSIIAADQQRFISLVRLPR